MIFPSSLLAVMFMKMLKKQMAINAMVKYL